MPFQRRVLDGLTFQIVPDRKVTDPSSQAQNAELGEQLWKISFEILREKLGKLDYDASV
jgi:hypothetical protein